MKIVYFEVGKQPRVMNVENKLEVLQKLVGGYIEVVYVENNISIVVNEEGLIQGLPVNRQIGNHTFIGNFFMVSFNDDDFCSLTNKQISLIEDIIDEKIVQKQRKTEIFVIEVEFLPTKEKYVSGEAYSNEQLAIDFLTIERDCKMVGYVGYPQDDNKYIYRIKPLTLV